MKMCKRKRKSGKTHYIGLFIQYLIGLLFCLEDRLFGNQAHFIHFIRSLTLAVVSWKYVHFGSVLISLLGVATISIILNNRPDVVAKACIML